MKEFWTTIQVVFAGIGGWLGWFLGGCDGLLYALLAFVVIDYITGIMCAVVDKKLSAKSDSRAFSKRCSSSLWSASGIFSTPVSSAAAR